MTSTMSRGVDRRDDRTVANGRYVWPNGVSTTERSANSYALVESEPNVVHPAQCALHQPVLPTPALAPPERTDDG